MAGYQSITLGALNSVAQAVSTVKAVEKLSPVHQEKLKQQEKEKDYEKYTQTVGRIEALNKVVGKSPEEELTNKIRNAEQISSLSKENFVNTGDARYIEDANKASALIQLNQQRLQQMLETRRTLEEREKIGKLILERGKE